MLWQLFVLLFGDFEARIDLEKSNYALVIVVNIVLNHDPNLTSEAFCLIPLYLNRVCTLQTFREFLPQHFVTESEKRWLPKTIV